MSTTDESKRIVRAYLEAGDRDDLDAWDALCDPAMTLIAVGFPDEVHGLATIKQFTAGLHAAMRPFGLTIDDMVGEGDRVAVRMTIRGTHSGLLQSPAGPVPPTGRQVTASGISIITVRNGKIVEERTILDIVGMMQQLGLIPAPAGAPA